MCNFSFAPTTSGLLLVATWRDAMQGLENRKCYVIEGDFQANLCPPQRRSPIWESHIPLCGNPYKFLGRSRDPKNSSWLKHPSHEECATAEPPCRFCVKNFGGEERKETMYV